MATLPAGTLAVPTGPNALAIVLRDLADGAAMHAAHSFARALADLGTAITRPLYRHRRGRGVSTSAKRRHARRITAALARCSMHAQAGRAWTAVHVASGAVAS